MEKRGYYAIIVFAAVFGLFAAILVGADPIEWPVGLGGNGHLYEAFHVPDGISWVDARTAALSLGAGWNLATITSAEENEFVFSLVADRPELWFHVSAYHGPWIGGWQDPDDPGYWEPGGGWKWVTEESWEFSAWASGEPSNSGGTEDRLQYFSGGWPPSAPTWNDTNNDHPTIHIRGYIAEFPEPAFIPTVSAVMACLPSTGTLPFGTQMTLTLTNIYMEQARTIAGRIDVTLASGAYFGSWRAGFTNVAAGSSYSSSWLQNIPALGSMIGDNLFALDAEDVTPAPYNQPPYPPAGSTDTATCTVTGIAP